ncbi:MAG: alpha/beta hydrolase [Syntrophales bacterium]|nr:alpha/beta hydrolase [Syntrophales bacterium]
MTYTTKTLATTDMAITYLVFSGEGPPLVCLHATGFLPHLWIPIARELSDTFAITAPYFCDHRLADPTQGGLNWRLLAEDLALFCREAGIMRPYLVGHSMGATVLVLASALYGVEPRAMVLIEPIFLPEDFYRLHITVDQHPLAAKAIRRTNRWRDREEARAYVRSRPLFQRWDEEMIDLYIQYGMTEAGNGEVALTCSPQREAALFMGGMQYDPWPEIAKVTCPTLVLEGEESENRAFIDLGRAVALLPRGEYRLVPQAGHLIPMEQPQTTARIIREFFTSSS